jgi:hypothetical protein
MRPIYRDGKEYSNHTVYWSNGAFYWYGIGEQVKLTDVEVQYFREFQNQPPQPNPVLAGFMQRHNAQRTIPKTRSEELQHAMWDIEATSFNAREDEMDKAHKAR